MNEGYEPNFNGSNPVVSSLQDGSVDLAAKLLTSSQVVALPTDTVYGLAANANDKSAIQKLYKIKGRDCKKPVAICVANIESLKRYGEAKHLPNDLLSALLPGPVTLVLRKTKHLDNPYLNPGCSNIGVRIPDCDFIRNVTQVCDFPVALTSANKSCEKSTLNVKEFVTLWPSLGAVFDGGQLGLTEEQRAASTVIDLSEPGYFNIIRDGIAVTSTITVLKSYSFKEKFHS